MGRLLFGTYLSSTCWTRLPPQPWGWAKGVLLPPRSLLPAFWNRAAAAARRCNRPWVAASACVSLRGKKVLTADGRRVLEGVPGRPIHSLSWAGGCERSWLWDSDIVPIGSSSRMSFRRFFPLTLCGPLRRSRNEKLTTRRCQLWSLLVLARSGC